MTNDDEEARRSNSAKIDRTISLGVMVMSQGCSDFLMMSLLMMMGLRVLL